MNKTVNLNVRMQPEIKDEAEKILSKLGISSSNAIDMFYRQIILNKGLPFELKLPETQFPDISELNGEVVIQLLEEGMRDVEEGRTLEVDQAFRSIYAKL